MIMKPQNIVKKEYSTPVIDKIKLDNEVSLTLDSTPPTGPNEGYLKAPEYINNDPFKTNVG
jgi:hypothetical protein